MEEAIKDRIILILSIVILILFVGTVKSCSDAYRNKAARDKEMATRLDLEEKFNSFSHEKASLESSLEEQKITAEEKAKALEEETLKAQQLAEELDKEVKLRQALEENLKDALAASKKKTKR